MEVIGLMLLIIVPLSSVWVAMDVAKLRGPAGPERPKGFLDMGPVGWFVSCLLLWIIAFPLYLVTRGNIAKAAENAATKKCPRCAEAVKPEAKVCRFCQHEFVETGMKPCPKCAGQVLAEAVRCKHCHHVFQRTLSMQRRA